MGWMCSSASSTPCVCTGWNFKTSSFMPTECLSNHFLIDGSLMMSEEHQSEGGDIASGLSSGVIHSDSSWKRCLLFILCSLPLIADDLSAHKPYYFLYTFYFTFSPLPFGIYQ